MADDGAMDSLLAAVAVAAASNKNNSIPSHNSPHPSSQTNPVTFATSFPFPTSSPPSTSTPTPTPNIPINISTTISPTSTSITRLAPINLPPSSLSPPLPPPPPPLPPPLPSPPPLPPMSIRTPVLHHGSPSFTEKRKGARVFSTDEKNLLEANYAQNKFPSRLNMETLGKAMSKGTEKVRTWYNNRRALDRKLGIDVLRNHPDAISSPAPYPDYASKPVEDTVILPSRLIASHPSSNQPSHPVPITPSKSLPLSVSASQSPLPDNPSLVNVTPSAIAWAPTVSPVTSERRQTLPSTPPCPNRFRISPLRIRHVRLRMASTDIYGEIPDNLSLDTGLEVKFLFGKKRVVYEWYCGPNYALAQSTGGPYAKMEMNFSTLHHMHLVHSTNKSLLILSFSVPPALFLQTHQSMDKYKIRSQQRQYRKVSPDQFPITVTPDQHHIWMRTDEAIRVSKILLEDTPRLAAILQVRHEKPQSSLPSFQTASTPSQPVSSPLPDKSSPLNNRRPLSVLELSSRLNTRNTPLHPKQEQTTPGPSHSTENPIVRPTTAAGAAANLLATPAPWHSPATPFTSAPKSRRDDALLWLSAVPSAMSNAPFSDHLQVESPVDAHVRRELNFSSIYRTKQPASVPSSLKRSAKDALEELDEGDRARRRISPGMQSLPLCIPAPPRPPQLPSPKEERLCDNEDDLLERLQTSDDAFQETKEPESDQISKSADLPQATSESSHAPDQQEGSERACHALPR